MNFRIIPVVILGLFLAGCVSSNKEKNTMSQNPTVTIKTSEGDIEAILFADQTPKTVENFLGLAEANKYDRVPFHRVIEDFMIQTGDYENQNGTGGQSIWGTEFEDEIVPELTHKKGVLSMANRGPGTNGSQFFIVHAEDGTPWLDGGHTVFGEVTEGLEVVDQIATTEVDLADRPIETIVIEDIIIN